MVSEATETLVLKHTDLVPELGFIYAVHQDLLASGTHPMLDVIAMRSAKKILVCELRITMDHPLDYQYSISAGPEYDAAI